MSAQAELVKAAAGALLLMAIGAGCGYKIADYFKRERIEGLERDLADLKRQKELDDELSARRDSYCDAVDAASARQDERIDALVATAQAHKAAAAEVVAAAQASSRTMQAEAAKLIASRPPAGMDACVAAVQAFDDELRAERAGGAK